MDLKKVDELVRMRNNCGAATDVLIIELLSVIANNTSRLVQIEENKISGQQELPLGNPNPPKVYGKSPAETKKKFEQEVNAKVEEAIDEVAKKPAPKKKAAPKKAEPKQEPVEVKEEPKAEAQQELPTKDDVMEKLVAFIQSNGAEGETKLAAIFKEMGGFANFPAVPQDRYPELLNKIAA